MARFGEQTGAHGHGPLGGSELAAGVEQRLGALQEPHRGRVETAAGQLAQALYLAYGTQAGSEMRLRLKILDAVLPYPVLKRKEVR